MKKMLLLKASEDIKNAEILNVASQAKLFQIEVDVFNIDSLQSLYDALNNGNSYDYIYLATHGDLLPYLVPAIIRKTGVIDVLPYFGPG